MKPKARVITQAWGNERYVHELLTFALPGLLAPGNLPYLVEVYSLEVIILSESRYFDFISRSGVYQAIKKLCKVSLISIDDFLGHLGMYGLTLTYAYHRGFADLGEEMLDYYLFFFNSDFILADGCYRTVVDRLAAGETLIVAPSYCVVAEKVIPILESHMSMTKGALCLSPREMAGIALQNRHNTIRAKTVNFGLFHMPIMEQFYWEVDDHTLLSQQLPPAVVALKPGRVYIEPTTFWDYGLVSEICPTVKPCVLGDSDDFVMIELRSQSWGIREGMQLLPGAPCVVDTAQKLSSFATSDQRNLGLYSLTLHDENLHSGVEIARIKLREYVEGVYRLLGSALSHKNHKFWVYHHAYLLDFQLKKQLLVSAPLDKEIKIELMGEITIQRTVASEGGPSRNYLKTLYRRTFGRVPCVTRNHPFWLDFKEIIGVIAQKMKEPEPRRLLISDGKNSFDSLLKNAPGLFVTIPLEVAIKHKIQPVDEKFSKFMVAKNPEPLNFNREGFDLCVCYVEIGALAELGEIYNNVKPSLRAGAKFVAMYISFSSQGFSDLETTKIFQLFHSLESSKISFSIKGFNPTGASRLSRSLFGLSYKLHKKIWPVGAVCSAGLMLLSLPFSRIANRQGELLGKGEVPKIFTSVTVEFH